MQDSVTAGSPSAAFVIPAQGRTERLARTLDSMTKAIWPSGFEAVRVVENGPKAKIEAVVHQYIDRLPIQYYNESAPGASIARNAGLFQYAEDIVIFFDNDICIEPHTLLAYRRAFDANGNTR